MIQTLFDAHQIGQGETGNETWARNVLRELEDDGRAPVHFALGQRGATEVKVDPARVHAVSGSSVKRLAVDLPHLVRVLGARSVLSQYTLPASRVPGVVVIHDLSFTMPEAREWVPRTTLLRYRLTIGASARRARVVLVPTEHTRRQVLVAYGLPPERVLVAPLAVDPGLRSAQQAPRAARAHHTVLCVGTVLPRKNLPAAALAVRRLRAAGDDIRLRLVGPQRSAGDGDLALMRKLLGAGLEEVGVVTLEQLAREYSEADVLAFPSLFEGFGLPVLEAMAMGTPVVSSRATCLPEVTGGAALLVDATDDSAWSDALGRVLSDEALRNRLRRDGLARASAFSWGRTGQVVREGLDLALS